MNSGKLRHSINIEKRGKKISDGIGGYTYSWQAIRNGKGIRAEIWTVKGSERLEAKQFSAEISHRVRMRYNSEVDENCRIIFEGKIFEITFANNKNMLNRELILDCKELK